MSSKRAAPLKSPIKLLPASKNKNISVLLLGLRESRREKENSTCSTLCLLGIEYFLEIPLPRRHRVFRNLNCLTFFSCYLESTCWIPKMTQAAHPPCSKWKILLNFLTHPTAIHNKIVSLSFYLILCVWAFGYMYWDALHVCSVFMCTTCM